RRCAPCPTTPSAAWCMSARCRSTPPPPAATPACCRWAHESARERPPRRPGAVRVRPYERRESRSLAHRPGRRATAAAACAPCVAPTEARRTGRSVCDDDGRPPSAPARAITDGKTEKFAYLCRTQTAPYRAVCPFCPVQGTKPQPRRRRFMKKTLLATAVLA